jgi:hypothetical protein
LISNKVIPDEDLFDVMEVTVKLNPGDMPGRKVLRESLKTV